MARIHCSVANCHYWKTGNVCDASQIMVTSNETGENMPDSFDAPMASLAQETPVQTCMETCCKTFVESGSDKKDVDGVYKK